jgi:hypothetical protein
MRLPSRDSYDQRGFDLYETPPVALPPLLALERFGGWVWDPCCGPGVIARGLRRAGHRVLASDVIDYGVGDDDDREQDGVMDFLKVSERPALVRHIVTNPPYRLAPAFIAHALGFGFDSVSMLLRLNFIAAQRRRQPQLFDQLHHVRVFARRLPMMHRAGWDGKKTKSSGVDFAWFTWRLSPPRYGTRLTRLTWRAE